MVEAIRLTASPFGVCEILGVETTVVVCGETVWMASLSRRNEIIASRNRESGVVLKARMGGRAENLTT